jgi:hypothetical protein
VDVLKRFPRNSYFHQHPDYYSVLGISKTASEKQISQHYRKAAKTLHPGKYLLVHHAAVDIVLAQHPLRKEALVIIRNAACTWLVLIIHENHFILSDKNPHPDAKRAFEALAAAHKELSDPVSRSGHDQYLQKKQQRRRSPGLVWERAQEGVQNYSARLLLLLARWRRGELQEEVASLKEFMAAHMSRRRAAIIDLYYKMKFAPSFMDRSLLLGEVLWSQKFKIVSLFAFLQLIVSLLTRP